MRKFILCKLSDPLQTPRPCEGQQSTQTHVGAMLFHLCVGWKYTVIMRPASFTPARCTRVWHPGTRRPHAWKISYIREKHGAWCARGYGRPPEQATMLEINTLRT